MKNSHLLPIYRIYSVIIIISAFMILIFSNFFIFNRFEEEKNENISNIMQKMNVQKHYIDKGMALMFINVYLQRSCIEDSLSPENRNISDSELKSRIQYDKDLQLSSLDAHQKDTGYEYGNIIINGNIKDIDDDYIKEISSMQGVFEFQDYLNRNSLFDIWSVYYAQKGYITIYPFSYTNEIIDDKEEVFEAVDNSIDQLNQLNDEVLYQDGWETDIFWDNTKSEIMLSKNLPVMVGNRIEGIVTSNISIKDIKKNIDVQEENDVYIVDSSDQIVLKNNEVISKIETLENTLKKYYNVEELKISLEPDKFHKVNGDYIINSSLDNVQWKMVYIVPGNKIERSLLERAIFLGLINGAIILISFLLLRILKRYYIKFSRIDELKTEFLMMISHDLKAPLFNILGFTELIQKKFSDVIAPRIADKSQEISAAQEKIHRNLGIIEKEASRLTALVDDLLDLSRLDSGEAELNKEIINISQLCNEVFDTTFSLADSKGIGYTMEIEPDLPDIAADRKKLMQVLVNIVSNAAKFTESGSIGFKVEKKGSDIVFSVEDTGVGIPKDMQRIIFNKFERGKFQNDKKVSGSGVGLSICKSIIELHDGEIWVVSKVNEGSTFSFSIPIEDIHGGI